MTPKTEKARLRSSGIVKVVVSRLSAAGASSAANAPCSARAPTRTPKLGAKPPSADAAAKPARPVTKTRLRPKRSPSRPPSSSRLPNDERVRGDDPLARLVGEAQRLLGGWQRDVHDRRVEHDHQLRDADEREDQPAAAAAGCVEGGMSVNPSARLQTGGLLYED